MNQTVDPTTMIIRRWRRPLLAGVFLGLSAAWLDHAHDGAAAERKSMSGKFSVEIDLSTVQARAGSARRLLHELRQRYDLSPWEYTASVRLAPLEIPHSHPVLTLNSRYAEGASRDEDAFLATYLHLVVNWFEIEAAAVYLGRERAEEVARRMPVYRSIYRTVIADREPIEKLLRSAGVLPLPPAGTED